MTKKFTAALIQNENMDAGYIEIPFDVEKEFGAKRVKVRALLNGAEYRGSLVRMGTECHILGIPKAMRAIIGVSFGGMIDVELEKDEGKRTVNMPEDLRLRLGAEGARVFESLSYTKRKEYISSVEGAKKESTRANRIEAIAEEIEKLV